MNNRLMLATLKRLNCEQLLCQRWRPPTNSFLGRAASAKTTHWGRAPPVIEQTTDRTQVTIEGEITMRTILLVSLTVAGMGLAGTTGVSALPANGAVIGDAATATAHVTPVWGGHGRWGSRGGHWRWGSRGFYGYGEHWRWGSRGGHWRWGSRGW